MEEQLAAQAPQELDERRRQEIIYRKVMMMTLWWWLMTSRPTHERLEKRNITAIVLVLLTVVGVVVFVLLRHNKVQDTSQEEAQAKDTVPGPTVSQTEAPPYSPYTLDYLVEELKFLIAPTSEDLLPFSGPSSPQSQALAWLQDDPITLTPSRSTRTVLERYVLAVFYYSTPDPSSRYDYLRCEDVWTWNAGIPAITIGDFVHRYASVRVWSTFWLVPIGDK